MNTTPLKSVKPGEYFKRKPDARSVFIKGAYDRATKTFECHTFDNVNKFINIKADKAVFVDFCF